MPDRYEPVPRSQLAPEQQKAYDEATEFADSMFGDTIVYKNDDGAFIGPFAPLLYTPTLMKPYFKLVSELGQVPGFPAKAKEIAILATGSVFKARYELYAHGKIAQTKGLSDHQITAVKNGTKPSGENKLDEQEEIAFDVAIELAKGGGALSKTNWQRALNAFGKEGAAALIHYIGIYAYTCILLNGADSGVPDEE